MDVMFHNPIQNPIQNPTQNLKHSQDMYVMFKLLNNIKSGPKSLIYLNSKNNSPAVG